MKYSLRSLMIVTAVVAVCTIASKSVYDNAIVPRVPLVWDSCTVNDIRQDRDSRRILIVSSNATISSSVYNVRYDVDKPAVRSIVSMFSIRCSTAPPSDELFSYLDSHGVEPNHIAPIIVVIDGKRIASFSYTGEDDGLLAQQIALFFKVE